MKENLGELIKKCRIDNKLSKEELAQKLGVTKLTITKWEKNISRPSFSSILLLSKELNLSFDEFILGYKITKDNKKQSEEDLKYLLKKNYKYKNIFNVFAAIFVCLCLCFIEVILFKYNMSSKDGNFIFMVLIFMLCFCAFTEGLEKANLFEEKNKYKEYGLLLIFAFIFVITGFILCIM